MTNTIYTVDKLPRQVPIGFVGENLFRVLCVDFSKWLEEYPGGIIAAALRRPDGQVFPVVLESDGTVYGWYPTATDLAVPGCGQLEFRITSNGVIGKTELITVSIKAALIPGIPPPAPDPTWLDQILEASAAAISAAEGAGTYASHAEQSAQNASDYATASAKSADDAEDSAQTAGEEADRAEDAITKYPYIGENNDWYVWNAEAEQFVDTGISAQGRDAIVESPTAPSNHNVLWRNTTDGKLYYYNGTAWKEVGSGGGGSSDELWRPTVSTDGLISWEKSTSDMPPQSRNIKGPKGDAGETGPQGDPGTPGQDGSNGQDGATFTPTVSSDGVISWTNDGGRQNPTPVNIKGPQGIQGIQGPPGADGADGTPGVDGTDGATFTPTVSSDGVISWTNDGGRQNPTPVNIKGPQGDPGTTDHRDLTNRDAADQHPMSAITGLTSAIEGKQATISDLDDIRRGAELGARAVQTESDPTVPAWAKQQTKPTYSKSEVGLGDVDNVRQYSASNPPPYPVTSVNGKTGTVNLGAADVGAATEEYVDGEVAEATTDMATQTWVSEKGYITAEDIPVLSVNGKTGTVTLTAADLGLTAVFNLKGSKPTYTALPSTGNVIGDVWYVVDESVGYIWLNDGTTNRWEQLGLSVDLSNYVTTEALATALTGYVTKVAGKGLSTNDFTDAYKTKLDSAITSLAGYATEAWVEGKGYLTQHQSLAAYRTSAAQDTIDGGKVDKVTGKGLSTNDFTNAYKDAVDANTTARHTHSNKSVLDGITSALVSAWNTASTWVTTNGVNVLSHLSDTVKHITEAERTAWNGKLGTSGDGSNVTAAFTQASTRANIATGEKLSVLFGKIAKWFADLKTVAFTGSYNDLSNKPTIPTVPTTLSAFTDDLGSSPVHTHSQYLTQHQSLAAYRTASEQNTIDNAQNTVIIGKENKGKITINSIERTAVSHEVTIVTNGVTTTFMLVGVTGGQPD